MYDRAEVLGADQIASLESQAVGLDQARMPTIVYLRRKDTDDPTTRRDARNLMEVWSVESAAGAKDGLVVFLNLRPADPRHGWAALVAGSAHATDGRLTDDRLQAVFDGRMRPKLAAGDIAGAIRAALSGVRANLQAPAPGPTVASPLARFVDGPLDALAAVLAAAACGCLLIIWRRNRAPSGRAAFALPDDHTPAAVAGALAAGRLPQQGLAATVLDLARKGALRIEATGISLLPYQLRLLDASRATANFEHAVMNGLAAQADGQGVVAASVNLVAVMRSNFRAALHTALRDGGLFAPHPARLPTRAIAALALIASTTVLLLTVVTAEPKGLLGAVLLLGVGVVGLVLGSSLPDTNTEGEQSAVVWRGLRAGLWSFSPRTIRPQEMGTLLPLAVALDAARAIDAQVSAAAAAGYWPEWFAPVETPGAHLLVAWRRLHSDLCSGQPSARQFDSSGAVLSNSSWIGGAAGDSASAGSAASDSSSGGGSF